MPNCGHCLIEKPNSKFYKRSDAKTFYSICKSCSLAYQAQRRKELPDYQRSRYLKQYGLTLDQYRSMFKAQKGQCAMCFMEQERALSVDHHHASGKVRALLCGSCNALLGFAKESVFILEAAIAYLDKHNKKG